MSSTKLRESLIDNVTTQLLDFHQRRITNAHPSIDDYDYVVRKELKAVAGNIEKRTIGGGVAAFCDKCTFGIGINSYAVVGTNVCPPYICAFKLQPIICYFKAGSAPTGAAFQAQIKYGSDDLFDSVIEIPSGDSSVLSKSDFAVTELNAMDYLTCNVTQVGSSTPGSSIVIVTVFKVIGV